MSLQSFRNSDSSGSTRSYTKDQPADKKPLNRQRSASSGPTLDNWNRKNPIPKIRTDSSDSSKHVSKSVSPPRSKTKSQELYISQKSEIVDQDYEQNHDDVENVIDERDNIEEIPKGE